MLLLALALSVAPAVPGAADARLDAFVARYREEKCRFDPGACTELGLHRYDALMPRRDAASIAAAVAWRKAAKGELAAVAAGPGLSQEGKLDAELLAGALDDDLLELDRWRAWQRDPGLYPSLATAALYALMVRDFAPAEERMASATERLRQLPQLLDAGMENVRTAAEPWARVARRELPATLAFLREALPAAFARVDDPRRRGPFEQARDEAIAALERYGAWLGKLPTTPGGFALGPQLFAAKLRAQEHLDAGPDELLAVTKRELARLRREFDATAKRLDPTKPPREVFAALSADHPSRDALLAETAALLDALRAFTVAKKLVTLPSDVMPRVAETPPFLRATTFASLDAPGPLETVATEAWFHVTLPDPSLPSDRQEELLRQFSRPALELIAVHETFPGHFTDFLFEHRWRPARQLVWGYAAAEGWAHYCEQLVVEEGLGDDRLRLAQLELAMQRAARAVAAIELHAHGWTVAQAQKLFEEDALMTPAAAEMEALRGTGDPGYFAYTLGKLQILKLRDDLAKKQGKAFDLRAFHDALLAAGPLPLVLVRRRLGLAGKSLPAP